jgi:hypothetical protein
VQGYQPVAQAVPEPGILNVVVPPGVQPGSVITVATPKGDQIEATVPGGVGPGQEFKISY